MMRELLPLLFPPDTKVAACASSYERPARAWLRSGEERAHPSQAAAPPPRRQPPAARRPPRRLGFRRRFAAAAAAAAGSRARGGQSGRTCSMRALRRCSPPRPQTDSRHLNGEKGGAADEASPNHAYGQRNPDTQGGEQRTGCAGKAAPGTGRGWGALKRDTHHTAAGRQLGFGCPAVQIRGDA